MSGQRSDYELFELVYLTTRMYDPADFFAASGGSRTYRVNESLGVVISLDPLIVLDCDGSLRTSSNDFIKRSSEYPPGKRFKIVYPKIVAHPT